MNTPRRLAWALGAALLLGGNAAAKEKWIRAQTEHFEMFSCASERDSREVLARLEQFRAAVLKIFPLRSNREPPTTVILFDRDRQFELYRPIRHGEHEEAGGYCIYDSAEGVIVLSAEYDRAITQEIIFHEYVHLLLAARGDSPPPWLNEGLAEFFSTFAIKKDKFEMGAHKPERVEVLLGTTLMPLGRLFAVEQESSEYHEGHGRDVFYAESWLLVHYAILSEDRKTTLPALQQFASLLATPGRPIEESFRKAFGMGYDEMERRLYGYLRGGRYHKGTGPLALANLASTITFAPADDFERELTLLDLRWRLQAPGDTTYRLMQLARQRPASPRPYELLAIIAAQDNDPEGALEKWRHAAELGSKNGYAYLVLAREKLDQMLHSYSPDYRLPDDLAATLRGWLDRALSLNPNYLDAFEALALVEAMAERPRPEVLNRIQESVPQMRDKSLTLFALAVVHSRVGHWESARQITDLLMTSPQATPQIRMLAEILHRRLPPAAAPPPSPGGSSPPAPAAAGAAVELPKSP